MTQSNNETPTTVQNIELDEAQTPAQEGNSILNNNMELFRNVKVKLDVLVGSSQVSVGSLLDLKENEVIKLDRDLAAPVDIILDGKVVAQGTLVAVDDNFGIQITNIQK